jgi:hypothetical protein
LLCAEQELARDYKGKGGQVVTRVDSGIVALCNELRAQEQRRN